MYSRLLTPPDQSFFLFGPRGTGKSTWVKQTFPKAIYFDLLNARTYNELSADPTRLGTYVPANFNDWIIIDEIQKIPALLDEVHRLIENKKWRFVLTGSSARKLRRQGVNLLAGRALNCTMHPFTAGEVKSDFDLQQALQYGQLPGIYINSDKQGFLQSYVQTYLKEEVLQEGLARNLGAFSRFMEAASFTQGATLNMSDVARECSVGRKVVEDYFTILEDLLVAHRLPVFSKRAKRSMATHPKFYFFDTGVYRSIRPQGPLDKPEEIDGAALETLVFQELFANNAYSRWNYRIYYWRTGQQQEVDFVLYGERGIIAIEVKRTAKLNQADFKGLRAFLEDYPMARAYMLYGGEESRYQYEKIHVMPTKKFLVEMRGIL